MLETSEYYNAARRHAEEELLTSSLLDLHELRTRDGLLRASRGPQFKDSVFGRDSIEVAEDLMPYMPELCRSTIRGLARLQGTSYDKKSGEEPGRIHHEYRLCDEGSADSRAIFEALAEQYGQRNGAMLSYASIDATPLFVSLVLEYCRIYGEKILSEKVVRLNGTSQTVRQSLLASIYWVTENIESSPRGFLEYPREGQGVKHAVWKDSATACIHPTGESANIHRPIAPVEVQGYAYDALRQSASYFVREDPEYASALSMCANDLQERVLRQYWIEPKDDLQGYFAQALDFAPDGGSRRVETRTSNGALLLNTGLFDHLPEDVQEHYVTAIASMIFSKYFLTDIGVRCRSQEHGDVVGFADYHGSEVVWAKETFDIAKGLRRQGFPRLARELEIRILNAVNIAGSNYEFFFVTSEGRAYYDPLSRWGHPKNPDVVPSINLPEPGQAWTASAVYRSKRRHAGQHTDTSSWRSKLEVSLLQSIESQELLTNNAQIAKARQQGRSMVLDQQAAEVASKAFKAFRES